MKFIVEARSVLPLFLPPADERKILACATSFLLTFTFLPTLLTLPYYMYSALVMQMLQ